MTTNVGQIGNPQIFIIPSSKMKSYIKNIKIGDDIPIGIQKFVYKNEPQDKVGVKSAKLEYLITEDDRRFINSLSPSKTVHDTKIVRPECFDTDSKKLSLHDLHWLHKYIESENKTNDEKVYLHELMENSEIVLPKNQQIPRSEELEKRCQKLKQEQQNLEYKNMTRNVDNSRRQDPEDTLGYQLRMMNKQLIGVVQFIITVAAGFAFGFMGIEILAGTLDFGVRLILGILCAITVGVADLYFFLKTLNDDLQMEYVSKKQSKKVS